MGEVTPLVSRTNAEWQPASASNSSNNDMQQRRRTQQNNNQQQNATHHHNGFYHNSPQNNDTNDDEYTYEFVDHRHANKGNNNSRSPLHRRAWQTVQQVWSQTMGMLPIVRGQVRARSADYCQDDPTSRLSCSPLATTDHSHDGTEYYEDTYNDESWACSMGTREAVSCCNSIKLLSSVWIRWSAG